MSQGHQQRAMALGLALSLFLGFSGMGHADGHGQKTKAHHSADFRINYKIDLVELLRVIQLFNSGEYHCQTDSGAIREDGYAPGPGNRDCEPHDSDYAGAPNWRISLTELLRVIQFFNVCGYAEDTSSEDGFRPVMCGSGEGEGEGTMEGEGEGTPEGAIEGEGEEGEPEGEPLKYARVVIRNAQGAPGTMVPVELSLETSNTAPSALEFDLFFNSNRMTYYGKLVGSIVTDAGKQLTVTAVNFGQIRVSVSGGDAVTGMNPGVLAVLGFTLSEDTDFGEVYSLFGQHLSAMDALTGEALTLSVLAGAITIYSADPIAPVASFSVTPSRGLPGTAFKFTDTSRMGNGTDRAWLWTFGDGQTSTERNPVHVYNAVGDYDVTLKVTTSAGVSAKAETALIKIIEGVRIYVDKDAAVQEGEARNGLEWETAFTTIQQGIDAAYNAGGGEVWVAAGTYDEARANSGGTLMLREVVRLYGGFAGSESELAQRDWELNPAIIDGAKARAGQAAYHVVAGANNASIDGFTITGGAAQAAGAATSTQQGGGMYNPGVSVIVSHCRFLSNTSQGVGGAMYISGGAPQIIDCQFESNRGEFPGNPNAYVYGGAIYAIDASLTIHGCTFAGNRVNATATWPGSTASVSAYAYGGAIYAYNCGMLVQDTVFSENRAEASGTGTGVIGETAYGAYAQALGGAVLGKYCDMTFSGCVFSNNRATASGPAGFIKGSGAGIYQAKGAMTAVNTILFSNYSSDFSSNPERTAGIHLEGTDQTILTNCSIVGNQSDTSDFTHGGALFCWYSAPVITNTIFWANSGAGISLTGSIPSITYCNIEDNVFEGVGNMDANPQFVLMNGGNLRLQIGSPCIDNGRGTSGPEWGSVTLDIEGTPRGFDGSSVVNADGSNYDIGAFEYSK